MGPLGLVRDRQEAPDVAPRDNPGPPPPWPLSPHPRPLIRVPPLVPRQVIHVILFPRLQGAVRAGSFPAASCGSGGETAREQLAVAGAGADVG